MADIIYFCQTMNTFLPYPDFTESARCLDSRRLGKQRVEAMQILRALANPNYGWQHHPAVQMWRGYDQALKLYMNAIIEEWVRRGYRNNMPLVGVMGKIEMPLWVGNENFHASHRSSLLRKDPKHYAQFCWKEVPDLPYIWPVGKGRINESTKK